jgi:nucleoside phosphorylase
MSFAAVPAAASTTSVSACTRRVLVLSAFPAELYKLIGAATLTSPSGVTSRGRIFYEGELAGKPVAMALTGIGPANAKATTEAAFARYQCGLRAVVFSGVAGGGGPAIVGDVTVPRRWTEDGGRTWQYADPAMLAVAGKVAPHVALARTNPAGDPLCVCQNADLVPTVTLKHIPGILIGGDGSTTDPFGGRAVPCLPGGGDLEGCTPCATVLKVAPNFGAFVAGVTPLLDPGFIRALAAPPPASSKGFQANDEETSAVAQVAVRHRTRFIGFRGISDGGPDPLMLPGFPAQFVVYKQLAADNSAAVALAFLRTWKG